MSIIFQVIRYKNFLSTGNNFIEVSLDETKRTLIVGGNGSGKTTIMDALCFALFGKMYRNINKTQIINSINEKECVVECEFKIGKKTYKIVRGIKPAIFEIYCNGKLVDQTAKTKDYQAYLEKNILNLNYKTFTQICILGSTNYKPFMMLTAQERREVIEDILDIQIFSTMNAIVKTKVSSLRNDIYELEKEIEQRETKIELKEKYIDSLKSKDQESIDEKKEQIQKNKKRAMEIIKDLKSLNKRLGKMNEIDTLYSSLKNQHDNFKTTIVKFRTKYDDLKKTVDNIKSLDECPTCLQGVGDDHKDRIEEKNAFKMTKIKKGMDDASSELQSLSDRLESASNERLELQSLNTDMLKKNTEITVLQESTITLQDEMKKIKDRIDSDTVKDQEELDQLREDEKKLKGELEENEAQQKLLKVSEKLLKDNGIKAKIISDYLPLINKQINHYLKELDFFVGFNLDENFKETIKSRHRDEFSYQSFSEGQKFRINIAILLTWREVAKQKNSVNTNLLMLDEVFDSSLDVSGVNDFTKLLNAISHDSTNVFVISHRGESMLDKFDRVIEFSTVKDFSAMKEVT